MDNLEEALEDYKKVLEVDPFSQLARAACMVLSFFNIKKKFLIWFFLFKLLK